MHLFTPLVFTFDSQLSFSPHTLSHPPSACLCFLVSPIQSHMTGLLISQPVAESISILEYRTLSTLRRANKQASPPPKVLRTSLHLVCSSSGLRICYVRFRARCRCKSTLDILHQPLTSHRILDPIRILRIL
ncbi:hypothetical protein BJX99DRAFT_46543 [Aspergillus californicus]